MVADDQLPTTEQGLQALVNMPTSDPKPSKWYQMMEHLPKDPWGHEYVYVCPGKHNPTGYDLIPRAKMASTVRPTIRETGRTTPAVAASSGSLHDR